jgi:hypothetical protein
MGPPYLGPQLAQSSECGDSVGSDGRECSGRQLCVSCGEFPSHQHLFEALRLFWLCGAGSGESTGDGWEISHWASSSVQPGIACRRKVSHRFSSYLVPKTTRVVMISESLEPESKPKP